MDQSDSAAAHLIPPPIDARRPVQEPFTRVEFAGQASRTSLDKLEGRSLSAEFARYLAYALAIASDAEALVVHIDSFGVERRFAAWPGDDAPANWWRSGPGVVIGLDRFETSRFPPI